MAPVGDFLERARPFCGNIIYTVSHGARGTALGEAALPLKRLPTEPLIYPGGFDKFAGGEMQTLLEQRGVNPLVLLGASTNVAVLYTATTASRSYHYDVIIPMDGVIAKSRYEQEYSFHQLKALPGAVGSRFRFTTLSMIQFV
jgi:nicotinamidase-related amidase